MKKLAYLAALLCVFLIPAPGQQPGKPLTNQDIVDMVDLGLSDEVIIAKINTAAQAGSTDFDTSSEAVGAFSLLTAGLGFTSPSFWTVQPHRAR
jgi:hypothetical protein